MNLLVSFRAKNSNGLVWASFDVFHHFHILDFVFQTRASNDVILRSVNQLAFWTRGSARQYTLFWRLDAHAFFLKTKALLNICWIHVGVTTHQPRMPGGSHLLHNRFHQRLIPRSSSSRVSNLHLNDWHPSCDVNPSLGDSPFIPRERHDGSFFFVNHCSQVAVSCHKKLRLSYLPSIYCWHSRQ